MKSVATLILLLLLVVCMVIPFASCANGDKQGTDESGKDQTAPDICTLTCDEHKYEHKADGRAGIVQKQCKHEGQSPDPKQQSQQKDDERKEKHRKQCGERGCKAGKGSGGPCHDKRNYSIHQACREENGK